MFTVTCIRISLRLFSDLLGKPGAEVCFKYSGYMHDVARMGERRGAYTALVGKPEGKRPLGRPRRRLQDNIKMNHREVGWGHGLDHSGPG